MQASISARVAARRGKASVNGETTRRHEVDFCAAVAGWASAFLAETDSPFESVRVEGYGAGGMRRKRMDLRILDKLGGLAITGEVRMPGAEDDDPYGALAEDASRKASNAGVKYFFTWNVNTFVLWDRSLWDRPLLERRVREWPMGATAARCGGSGAGGERRIHQGEFPAQAVT